MGVRVGASYRELLRRFGHSTGILFSSGGAMMYQTQPTFPGAAGLPSFGTEPATGQAPVWVMPLQPAGLTEEQSEWVYDWRHTKGVALGIILSGKGADAVVTDVIVAGFPENLKGKPSPVLTEKGIGLQSTFADVLRKYGYPPMIEIYAPSGGGAVQRAAAPQAAGGGRAMRAGGGRAARGTGGGARGGGGRRAAAGGRGGASGRGGRMRGTLETPTVVLTAGPDYQLELTGGMMGGGRRGGGAGRGGRGGGGGAGARAGGGRGGTRGAGARTAGGATRARGAGRGTLPPLGQPAVAAADVLAATAVVDNQTIGFSRDCILVYEGIAFTLHDMRVVRIHVSE